MSRLVRRKSDNVISMSPVRDAEIIASEPTPDDIARRAFETYCERGREDGHDLDDWLQAERDLRDNAAVTTAA